MKIEGLNEEFELSSAESAILEKLLKGQLTEEIKSTKIPKRDVFSPVPLSFGQRRLWIIDQLVPGKAFYNIPSAYRLQGRFDAAVFERSLNEMVRRHESLRTIFSTVDEEPVQVILPEFQQTLTTVDLQSLPREEQEGEVRRLAFEEGSRPFDLKTGPLLRMTLLCLGRDEYVLLFNMHHIIADTWSMEVFVKEIGTIYRAFAAGLPSPLPDPPLQYPDFALWQRDRMKGEELERQLSYWRGQLGRDIPLLELPADRQRPAVQTFSGGSQTFTIPGETGKRLVEISQDTGCSVFMVLLAALNVLLYHYSGQEDILVGSPIANRNRVELEGLIGYISNTLVFRTDLSGNPGFRELLARVRRVASGAYDNQDIPFEKLVELFQPERYMSHTPLFQVMFNFQNRPSSRKEGETGSGGFDISPLNVHNETCKFDLWLSMSRAEKDFSGTVEYNGDIFEDTTITRLVGHFQNLMEHIAANSDLPVNQLSLLSQQEKDRLLLDWNDTKKDYRCRCLHHAFEDQVNRTPGADAVIFEDQTLTYDELNTKAGQLAALLNQKGVETGTVVAIMAERSLEMVVGLYGILKAGGAYLPVDPEYPEDRIRYMLADSGAGILLSNLGEMGEMSEDIEVIDLNTVPTQPFVHSSHSSTPRDLAYIIYTSGSTGKPRGVMVPHEGISNRLLWMQEAFGLTPGDRILQKTPFSFDVSVWEFFWPLLNGAVLVMTRPGGHKDPQYLVDIIEEQKITTIHFVPSMLNVFLEADGVGDTRWLKRVICSGEALPVEYQKRFFQFFEGKIELHNLYGPTEASVDVTHWPCGSGDDHRSVPIGRPIANTCIYILDRDLNLVPTGVHGELYIGGIQLARGYLNKPELTAEKFINKSFSGVQGGTSRVFQKSPLAAGGTLYGTGDLARWLPDGNIEFLGRIDHQVKVRGFRIELGEIESRLRGHPYLEDAAVVAREDEPGSGDKKLAAYIVPDNDYRVERQKTAGGGLEQDQVSDWQGVFDETYSRESHAPGADFNIVGWNSSYTMEPIPAEEMRQWVDHTVRRILALKPRRVLEIGCGTGLMLFNIISHCDYYLGTDISATGLDYIRRQLDHMPPDPCRAGIRLLNTSAENFADIADIEPGGFDLVIINSVVQYFPGTDYLLEVLKGAVNALEPGGSIFIGDVRHLPLLKTFHASVEFHRLHSGVSGSGQADVPAMTRREFNRKVLSRVYQENELVIDPEFFRALNRDGSFSRLTHVETHLKRGTYLNELSKYRYDVLLRFDQKYPGEIDGPVLDWRGDQLTIAVLRRVLKEKEPRLLCISGVPNARIAEDLRIFKWLNRRDHMGTLGQLLETPVDKQDMGVDPMEFQALEEGFPYDIDMVFSPLEKNTRGQHVPGDSYDVVFKHRDLGREAVTIFAVETSNKDGKPRPLHTYANNPLSAKMTAELVPELKDFLKETLPEYMVPSYFTLMDMLPLTSSGKLDRRALPLSEPVKVVQDPGKECAEPRTENEKLFASTWAEVLEYEKIDITGNFFELGGDSINAIRVISRLNKRGFKLSIQDLYKNQTVEALARAAGKMKPAEDEEEPVIIDDLYLKYKDEIAPNLPAGAEIEDIYPASPLQCHMLNYLKYHPGFGIQPPVFLYQRSIGRVPLKLDINILKQTLQKLTDSHTILRTVLYWENMTEPVQVVLKTSGHYLVYRDLSGLSPEEQEQGIKELNREEWERGFQRNEPIPFRIGAVKLAEEMFHIFFTCDYSRLDGWGAVFALVDIIECYGALISGREFNPPVNNYYKTYIYNLKKRDPEKAREYWLSVFEGYTGPKALINRFPGNLPGEENGENDENGFGIQSLYLSAETTDRMERLMRKERLVVSTVAKAVWALIMSRYAGEDEIVFGFLTTGRSIASAEVETMSGHAINVLPVRMKINPDELLLQWLRKIMDNHMEWIRYEYTQIENLYQWLGVSMEQPLFETFLVVQNIVKRMGKQLPATPGTPRSAWGFDAFHAKMEYPLRVDLDPGVEICITFNYYRSRFADGVIHGFKENVRDLMHAIVDNPGQTVGELMNRVSTEHQLPPEVPLEKLVRLTR